MNLRQTINLSSTLMAAEDKFMQFNSVYRQICYLLYFPSLLFAFVRSSSAFDGLTLRSMWAEVPLSVPRVFCIWNTT